MCTFIVGTCLLANIFLAAGDSSKCISRCAPSKYCCDRTLLRDPHRLDRIISLCKSENLDPKEVCSQQVRAAQNMLARHLRKT